MLTQEHLTLQWLRLKSPERWTVEPNRMLFVFPKGGSGEYRSPQVTHRLAPGDVLILHPMFEGEMCAADGGEIAFCFFSVSVEHLFSLFASEEISLLHNVCEGFKTTKLHGAATTLAKECHRLLAERPSLFGLGQRAQLLQVAAAALDDEFKTAQPQRPGFVRAEDHLIQVFEKLSADDFMTLSVDQLAARFGCSKRHLSRLFQRYFGVSVAAMKMEMRMCKAVALLRDPDVKIISVSEQCGFNYLGHFNTCFKRRFGTTPGQRRKMMAESEGRSRYRSDERLVCPLCSKGLCVEDRQTSQPRSEGFDRNSRKSPASRFDITVKPLGMERRTREMCCSV